MLLRMKNSLLLFLGAVFLLAGCRKDGGDETPHPFLTVTIRDDDSTNPPTTFNYWITDQSIEKVERIYDGTTDTQYYYYQPGCVICSSFNGAETVFHLNEQNLCIRVEYPDGTGEDIHYDYDNHISMYGNTSFEWRNGNMEKVTIPGEIPVIWEITYVNSKVDPFVSRFDWYQILAGFFPSDLYTVGLGGQPSRGLATKATNNQGDSVIFEYTYDEKGRVKTSKRIWTEFSDIITYSYYD